MFDCKACASKSAEIEFLRHTVAALIETSATERDEARKDLLAVADRNAANQRTPRPHQDPPGPSLTTPAQIRANTFRPAPGLTPEEIEAAFKGTSPELSNGEPIRAEFARKRAEFEAKNGPPGSPTNPLSL
jgi:hypothetical protein